MPAARRMGEFVGLDRGVREHEWPIQEVALAVGNPGQGARLNRQLFVPEVLDPRPEVVGPPAVVAANQLQYAVHHGNGPPAQARLGLVPMVDHMLANLGRQLHALTANQHNPDRRDGPDARHTSTATYEHLKARTTRVSFVRASLVGCAAYSGLHADRDRSANCPHTRQRKVAFTSGRASARTSRHLMASADPHRRARARTPRARTRNRPLRPSYCPDADVASPQQPGPLVPSRVFAVCGASLWHRFWQL
ncbi:hypothetical protein DB30_06977 [Enhygromyxa salina]|uniref:Uncharacterized protein n=1 Tax=Enhygromyxa salina TaxID=215803 RepID=A0A0C1ZT83_9BACT|nr:hypothetical protein DB30_06977 [Enhygromyxa salina]